MTGIVLSGGESRRMGTDKAFLKIAGLPMVEHVIRALSRVVNRVIIVTNSPKAYESYDVEVTGDAWDKRGSLIGLYSGLLRSQDVYNIVVACDMPFLNSHLLQYMADQTNGYDVVMPKIGEQVEPLHAVYHRDLLPVIQGHLERDERRIRSVFTGRRIRYITEEEVRRFDAMRRSFINVNTPDEYEEVLCSDLECRS